MLTKVKKTTHKQSENFNKEIKRIGKYQKDTFWRAEEYNN